jgi:hypothetical protein
LGLLLVALHKLIALMGMNLPKKTLIEENHGANAELAIEK